MKLGEAIVGARKLIPAAEARLLLMQAASVTATEIAAHPERDLDSGKLPEFMSLVARRVAGEPIAYLLGRREFYGRDFVVTPAVLIPRPETELLVDTALAKVSRTPCGALHGSTPRILDLGAGSGCVAITLALELGCEVTAVDVSADALAVARDNANRLGARVRFIASDWFAAIEGQFDLIVGNPPYVAEGDAHLSEGDLRFEPVTALACGVDGLSAIRRILADAPRYLVSGGWLFLEHGYDQAEAMRRLLEEAGFGNIEQHHDLAGIVRVSGGVLTAGNT
ncbi:MAG: peptide chain release factor N(5)-glutamine methyltransferase [Rhodocyclales bacterium]|nr:peptide chain release factor N(5)-glutamine methyltransferase [Rhodocyclales bacterium]